MYLPFTLYRRPTKKKRRFIYYVQFRNLHGHRMTAVSSGKTTRAEAEQWAYQRLQESGLTANQNVRFAAYAADWFIWERCRYLERKRRRGDYSRSYAEQQRAVLERHILPFFGSLQLRFITPEDVEEWLLTLRNRFSEATANRSLTVLKIMLKEAKRQGLTTWDPAESVEKLLEHSREKGILTLAEFRQLFEISQFQLLWDGSVFHYTLNALAGVTGMRMGEIQALRWCCVQNGFIDINHSWNRKYGLTKPKANSARVVSIPALLTDCLSILKESQSLSDPQGIVFHGDDLYRPIDHKVVMKHLYRAFKKIGIGEAERSRRNLTFHSWRHFLNSNLRTLVADADLQRITGHRTLAMTEHYDHATEQRLSRIRFHQEDLLGLDPQAVHLLST